MKEMDSIGLRLCSYQALLFDHSIEGTNCSSKIFIRRFMNSTLAERMDNRGFLSLDPLQAIERIEEDKGLDRTGPLDDIARGVNILRKARSKK